MKKRIAVAMAAVLLAPALACSGMVTEPLLWWELEHPERFVNGYDDPDRDIWEVRNEAELLRRRLGQPKQVLLRFGPFPTPVGQEKAASADPSLFQAWLAGPDGSRQPVPLQITGGAAAVEVPGPNAPAGIYLLGSHYSPGSRDVDGDGVTEEVHFHGKFLVKHGDDDVTKDGEKNVFFSCGNMPLEIGPVEAGRYSGIIQIAHRPHTMAVFYRGKTLADAEVTVLTERGWQTRFTTGSDGRFEIVPVASRGADRNCELYLYVARHHDRQRGEYHFATIPMIIDPPWPEWSHYTTTLITWGLAGTLFAAMLAFGLIERRRRRDRARLARFKESSCV